MLDNRRGDEGAGKWMRSVECETCGTDYNPSKRAECPDCGAGEEHFIGKRVAIEEKKRVSARVSAITITALASLILEVQEFAASEFAFFNQMPTQKFGTYLIPHEQGIIVAVCDAYRMLAVHDTAGHASEVVKVFFPDTLLEASKPSVVTLSNENGSPFDVTCDPKPHVLHINEGFCILFPDDMEKWKGTFGTWFNGDHGNVIDRRTFRAEPADASFLSTAKESEDKSTDFNPQLLTNIFKAADSLGCVVTLDYSKGVLEVTGDGLCGYVMPCLRKELQSYFVRDALLGLAKTVEAA